MSAFWNSDKVAQFDDEAIRQINSRQAQLLFGNFIVTLVLIVVVAILAMRRQVPSYVIALNSKGEVAGIAHPVADPDNTLPASVTRYVLEQFIEDAKGASNNIDLERDRLNSVYAFARGQALKAIDDYYKADDTHNPMKQALSGHWTEVSITRCLKQPEPDTYLIEWSESTHEAQGRVITNSNWQALIKVAVTSPDPNNALNPIGLYIVNLDMSPAPASN